MKKRSPGDRQLHGNVGIGYYLERGPGSWLYNPWSGFDGSGQNVCQTDVGEGFRLGKKNAEVLERISSGRVKWHLVSKFNQRRRVNFMKSIKQETKRVAWSVCLGALALILIIGNSPAHAQEYPSKPITIIVPAAPGGGLDVLGRLLAQEMGNSLKQRIIVENVPGAGATIGTARAAKSPGDGYTILIQNMGISVAPALYRKLPFDPITDLEPIGRVADMPMGLVARKDFPAKDFKEMLAYIKTHKSKINFAHAGTGSSTHLCSMLFMSAIETDLTMVSYKGAGPALTDLMGGQVDLLCESTISTSGHIKSGTIKIYGVASSTRVSSMPDVPTIKETGLLDFEIAVWNGLWAPKGTPKPIINKLSAALQEALKSSLLKQRLADFGTEPAPHLANPEALRVLLHTEIKKWAPLIKKAGVFAD